MLMSCGATELRASIALSFISPIVLANEAGSVDVDVAALFEGDLPVSESSEEEDEDDAVTVDMEFCIALVSLLGKKGCAACVHTQVCLSVNLSVFLHVPPCHYARFFL